MTVAAWELVKNYPFQMYYQAGVRFNKAVYLIGGIVTPAASGGVIVTPDGYNEKERLLNLTGMQAGIFNHAACVFNGKIFVSGGQNQTNQVYSSADGKIWTQVGTTPDGGNVLYAHRMKAFGNDKVELVILGGNLSGTTQNRILRSKDGHDWAEVNPQTSIWAPRGGFGCLVYKNKLWIFGGYSFNGVSYAGMNDVWYTDDLIHWTRAPDAPWSPRFDFGYCKYDERMWMIGGKTSYSPETDIVWADPEVWFTRDGITWQRAFDFPTHLGLPYVSKLDNRMYVFGGLGNENGLYRMNLG